MAELTPREKTIIHIMNVMMNPQTKNVPLDMKVQAILFIIKVKNLPFEIPELKDLSHAIEAEQNSIMQEAFGLLAKHPELAKNLQGFKL